MNTTANTIFSIAAKHASTNDSARLCLVDAKNLLDKGEEYYAAKRSVDSLCYSVGIFGAEYKEAKALLASMSC